MIKIIQERYHVFSVQDSKNSATLSNLYISRSTAHIQIIKIIEEK